MVQGVLHRLAAKSASSFAEIQEGFNPSAREGLTCREYTVTLKTRFARGAVLGMSGQESYGIQITVISWDPGCPRDHGSSQPATRAILWPHKDTNPNAHGDAANMS